MRESISTDPGVILMTLVSDHPLPEDGELNPESQVVYDEVMKPSTLKQ
jgi:hypothetical protein